MRASDARVWLRANDYDDVADMIDGIMESWAAAGTKTRRNWWEILAGDRKGNPRIAAGMPFPVLRAAQHREGRSVENGIWRDPDETAPAKAPSNRWPKTDRP